MTRIRIVAAMLLLAASGIGLGGCGYTWGTPYRTDVRTVCVPIFNRGAGEFRRDIEIRLTESIAKRIEAETPYKVVDRKTADTELTGTLVAVKQHVRSYDPDTGNARSIQMQMIVDFTWKDLRTGLPLAERKNFAVTALYIPLPPFSEDFFEGSEDAINRIALRIVEQMMAPF